MAAGLLSTIPVPAGTASDNPDEALPGEALGEGSGGEGKIAERAFGLGPDMVVSGGACEVAKQAGEEANSNVESPRAKMPTEA